MKRREFLRAAMLAAAAGCVRPLVAEDAADRRGKRPNVVFILVDQWRAQATGYAGDPNAKTPNLDRLAARAPTSPTPCPAARSVPPIAEAC